MTSMSRKQLPLSLIECEILPKLPAKSVGRCMCVCKQWRSLLSTPTFTRTHLRHNVTAIDQYKLLLLDHNNGGYFILASLDGLVCLGSPSGLAFWNPLTGAYKQLAPIPDGYSGFTIYDGFGFYTDSGNNDYKLVYMMMMGGVFGVYIYSHGLDSWRPIDYPKGVISDDVPFYYICSEATAFNQCLYFIITNIGFGTKCIICFDVKTEKIRKIGFPDGVPAGGFHTRAGLISLDGCIHLCVSYYNINNSMWCDKQAVDLWRMDGDDGWAKVFSEPMYSSGPKIQKSICATTTGNWVAVLEEDDKAYEIMNTEDFTARYRYYFSPSFKNRYKRIVYVETLVSP